MGINEESPDFATGQWVTPTESNLRESATETILIAVIIIAMKGEKLALTAIVFR